MDMFNNILILIKELGKTIYLGFLALFIHNTGVNSEVNKTNKKDLKDAKKAGKQKNHIATLSSDELRSGLLRPKPKEPKS